MNISQSQEVRFMDRNDIFWQMIKAGWGETPQDKIPGNWREVPGPDPWPTPFMEASKERKKRKRLTSAERIERNDRELRNKITARQNHKERRRQARIRKYGADLSHSEMIKENWRRMR